MARTRLRTARPPKPSKGVSPKPQLPGVSTSRVRLARTVLVACGVIALASAFLVPFLNAASFYGVVVRPAFALSPSLSDDDIDALSTEQKALFDALALSSTQRTLGQAPLPEEEAPRVTLTAVESLSLAAALADASSQAGELQGETELIARFMQVAVLSIFLLGLLTLFMPLIPGLGAHSTWTIVATGTAAMLVLSSHLLSLSVDMVGASTDPIFVWPSHVVSFALVAGVGLGSMLPMGMHNALRAVLGTMVATTVTLIAAALYVAL